MALISWVRSGSLSEARRLSQAMWMTMSAPEKQRLHEGPVEDVADLELGPGRDRGREVLGPTDAEVVDRDDLRPAIDKSVDHMAADEPGAASNDNSLRCDPHQPTTTFPLVRAPATGYRRKRSDQEPDVLPQ